MSMHMLGGVKKEVGIIELKGQKRYYYSKKYYISVIIM